MLKPVVCYLFTCFDQKSSFYEFLSNYKKFKAGTEHTLVICFKLLNEDQISILKKNLINISYEEFIDPESTNDFDFGSYKRVAEKYSQNYILFLNSHSYPISDNWLSLLSKFIGEKTLIGTSASCESILTSTILKKKYKFLSFFLRKFRYKKKFNNFPNPHLRTSSFFIKGYDYIDFISNKKIRTKEDAWDIESGKFGLTNYFKNKGFNIFVINSLGQKFSEIDWKYSKTYNYLDQEYSIISDKHTRKYLSPDNDEKKIYEKNTWG